MPDQTIENSIDRVLIGNAQELALDFVTYLRAQDMHFERGTGYWEDKHYWIIKYKDESVCFILINSDGDKTEPEGWVIWSDDSGSNWFEDVSLDERTKETAWTHVDICGNCGGCINPGGSHKTIFGKDFNNVCTTAMRFDNPNAETVEYMKKMVDLRKNSISKDIERG